MQLTILTPEIAEEAVALVAPAIEAYLGGPDAARNALHAVVAIKRSLKEPEPTSEFVYERSFGDDPSTWEEQFDDFARNKGRICLRTGLNSDEAIRNQPWALAPGDITYRGGIVLGFGEVFLVVACSGIASRDDEMFAYMIAHAIRAILRRHVEKTSNSDEAYLPTA